jgi:hypothetical protein
MKRDFSYKKRLIGVSIACLIMAILCWNFAFSKTVHLITSSKNKKEKLAKLNEATSILTSLEREFSTIDNGLYSRSGSRVSDNFILGRISYFMELTSVKLMEMPGDESWEDGKYNIRLQRIVLQGKFTSLLSFLHLLEKEKMLGKVCSAEFYINKPSDSVSGKVFLKVYIKIITTNKS